MTTEDLQIGELKRMFRPNLINQIAGYIIVLLIMGGGCFFLITCVLKLIQAEQMPVFVKKGESLFSLTIGCFFGTGMIVSSIFLFRWLKSIASLRVFLGEDGFCVIRDQRVEVFTWEQIDFVEETVHYESPPLLVFPLNRLLPKIKSRSFLMRRKDGYEFGFNANHFRDHATFADLVKREMIIREIPWLVEEDHS